MTANFTCVIGVSPDKALQLDVFCPSTKCRHNDILGRYYNFLTPNVQYFCSSIPWLKNQKEGKKFSNLVGQSLVDMECIKVAHKLCTNPAFLQNTKLPAIYTSSRHAEQKKNNNNKTMGPKDNVTGDQIPVLPSTFSGPTKFFFC